MKNYRTILNESGLSRIYLQTQKFDYGTITAFRSARECNTGKPYTKTENKARNKSLLNKMMTKGYSVTKIKGSYIENYGSDDEREVGESSFIVIDIKESGKLKSDLLKFGEAFEQDSVIYSDAGGKAALIGTNKCPNGYPGYHKSISQGAGIFGKTGEFMSRVKGRPFVFSESIEVTTFNPPKYPTEIRSMVELSKQDWENLT